MPRKGGLTRGTLWRDHSARKFGVTSVLKRTKDWFSNSFCIPFLTIRLWGVDGKYILGEENQWLLQYYVPVQNHVGLAGMTFFLNALLFRETDSRYVTYIVLSTPIQAIWACGMAFWDRPLSPGCLYRTTMSGKDLRDIHTFCGWSKSLGLEGGSLEWERTLRSGLCGGTLGTGSKPSLGVCFLWLVDFILSQSLLVFHFFLSNFLLCLSLSYICILF